MLMPSIDESIRKIDNVICRHLDEIENNSRGAISQDILEQLTKFVNHIMLKFYANGRELPITAENIAKATEFAQINSELYTLYKFHNYLEVVTTQYTLDEDGSERLMLKYYQYFVMIRGFVKDEYGLEILHNLEKFPTEQDETIELFHEKIVEKLKMRRQRVEYDRTERLYVHKVAPFVVGGRIYFEMVLTPAYDTTSKFERFIAYATYMIPSHYSIKAAIFCDTIEMDGNVMPISIMTEYTVSVRPCELNLSLIHI